MVKNGKGIAKATPPASKHGVASVSTKKNTPRSRVVIPVFPGPPSRVTTTVASCSIPKPTSILPPASTSSSASASASASASVSVSIDQVNLDNTASFTADQGNNLTHLSPIKSPSPRKSNTRSDVWIHFTKLHDSDGNETGRAECLWCHKNYQGNSEGGTSGLWKHLRETCKKFPYKKELQEAFKKAKIKGGQLTISFSNGPDGQQGNMSCWQFDQDACRAALVRMVIKDEMPFRIVEREGFLDFMSVCCPSFQIPSRFTLARDCYSLFVEEKKKLHALISSQCQRISLTTDT